MDESLTETLHRATDLASKGTNGPIKLWDITQNARDLSSFSTEIKTATAELLPYVGLALPISTLKETDIYEDTLWNMLQHTPGEIVAMEKRDEKDGLTVVAIATIAVLCANCGLYPPDHVESKNIASLLWDCKMAAVLKKYYPSDKPRNRTVVPDSTAGSECDADTEDESNASTDDVYEHNVGRHRRGAGTTWRKDNTSHDEGK